MLEQFHIGVHFITAMNSTHALTLFRRTGKVFGCGFGVGSLTLWTSGVALRAGALIVQSLLSILVLQEGKFIRSMESIRYLNIHLVKYISLTNSISDIDEAGLWNSSRNSDGFDSSRTSSR